MRNLDRIVKYIIAIVLLLFLLNVLFIVINDDADAASKRCPKGHSSLSVTRYWGDSDATNNWRLGEINIKASACFGGKGKIKSSHATLYVRTNNVGEALGYRIYRLEGSDYVGKQHGLYKVYHLFAQDDQCLIPVGGGHICNHAAKVDFQVTIWSPKAMHQLAPYQPSSKMLWLWQPANDRAADYFELWSTP